MKYFLFIIAPLIISCEKPADCIKSTGAMTTKRIEVTQFDKIVVYSRIGLVVSEGPEYGVTIQSGTNLIDDIEVLVTGNQLTLRDNTTCNWVRDYGQTTVYVTAPNLTSIYSKTEQNISSNGILTFDNLTLSAIDNYDGQKGAGTGDFNLQINNSKLSINNNNVAGFTIIGKTKTLTIGVYEGNGIIDANLLLADKINIYHRGSNDIRVHPINEITGDIFNVGNIMASNIPQINTVHQHYTGQLLFN